MDIVDAEVELLGGGQGFRLKSGSSLIWTELRSHTVQEAQDWVAGTSCLLWEGEHRGRPRIPGCPS